MFRYNDALRRVDESNYYSNYAPWYNRNMHNLTDLPLPKWIETSLIQHDFNRSPALKLAHLDLRSAVLSQHLMLHHGPRT